MVAEIYLSVSPFGADGLDRAAEIAGALGCTGLEVPAGFLSGAAISQGVSGIPIRVLTISWRPDRRGDIAGSMALAKQLGVPVVNIYGGLGVEIDASAARKAFIGDVRSAIDGTPDDSPALLLENELAKAPGFSAAYDAWVGLLQAVDSPRFQGTLDAANFIAAGDGEAIRRIIDEAVPLIGHVHAKGVMRFDSELHTREPFRRRWQGDGEWLSAPAGEGSPDWGSLLGGLLTRGYTGAVTVEPFQEAEVIGRAVDFIRAAASSQTQG